MTQNIASLCMGMVSKLKPLDMDILKSGHSSSTRMLFVSLCILPLKNMHFVVYDYSFIQIFLFDCMCPSNFGGFYFYQRFHYNELAASTIAGKPQMLQYGKKKSC